MARRPILHLRFGQPVDRHVDGDDRSRPAVGERPRVRIRKRRAKVDDTKS